MHCLNLTIYAPKINRTYAQTYTDKKNKKNVLSHILLATQNGLDIFSLSSMN